MIGLLRAPSVVPMLGDTVATLARKHRVPGAQLALHRDGETVAVKVGELEHRTGRPVTGDAAFPIGSITKSFTATVAMILVADGDLDLDQPIGDHLPELGELGAELTLRQLLSHTGGLASGPDSEDVFTATPRRYVTDHCHRRNMVLPSGTGFSYSNLGYVVVGHLIETITGMSWWEAMESILLRPLGIDPAFIGTGRYRPHRRPMATGHSVNLSVGRTRPVRQSLAPPEAATGALALSATDLVSLGLIQVGAGMPDVLSPRYATEMRQPVAAAEPYGLADGWGLGLAAFRHEDTEWIGHDGNAGGTSCYLRIDPAGGWVVAFTSNANNGTAMWQDLIGELADAGVPIGPSRAWMSPSPSFAPPNGCAGTYANGDVEYVVAAKDGGRLHLSIDGDPFARLTFHEDLTFSLRDPETGQHVFGGRFMRDRVTAAIGGIQLGGRLARRRHGQARGETVRQLVA